MQVKNILTSFYFSKKGSIKGHENEVIRTVILFLDSCRYNEPKYGFLIDFFDFVAHPIKVTFCICLFGDILNMMPN